MIGDQDQGITVLLVEDDEDDYIITKHLLSDAEAIHFHLIWADRFGLAIEMLQTHDPDVVLLDLSLPDSSGWKTLVNMLAKAPRIPVILLTGNRDEAMGVKAVQEGAQDYLFKGYLDREGLARSIRYAIERKRGELAFKEYQEHLEEMVQERTYELRRANRELTQQIQHRIKIEREIEDSKNYLEAIISGSHDGICLIDDDGCFEFGNEAFIQTLGWPRDELMGQLFMKCIAPDFHDFFSQRWEEVQRGEGAPYEVDIVTEHDERRSLSISHQRITIASEPKYCIVMKDITIRKRNEMELRRALEQLKAHDQAKTQFVSNVSHELKTPLASMTYAVDNIKKGIVGPVPDRMHPYLDMLSEDAERLGRAIGDILDMSRLESNTLTLERTVIPFGPFVRHIVQALRLQAEEKALTLHTAINGVAGFVSCDTQKMERVILNVIRNAVKFTPDHGEIEVALLTDPEDDQTALLTVTDTGIGIPEEHLDRVTERYFRVGEYVDGTGLGLAITKEIVVLHGGTLRLQSPPPGRGTGTRVCISLPRTVPPAILIVDDCEETCLVAGDQLSSMGYTVNTSFGGAEALARLEAEEPALILTDLQMPGMSGLQLIATIKGNREWAQIPLVAITGGDLDPGTSQVLEGFAIPALTKPWEFKELLATIEWAIMGRQFLAH